METRLAGKKTQAKGIEIIREFVGGTKGVHTLDKSTEDEYDSQNEPGYEG